MNQEHTIKWDKLAQIEALQEFFQEDFTGFQNLVEYHIEEFSKFSDKTLDKFAKMRALEVTNGCTQWAFRESQPECLSVEKTRECMKLVMGFIKKPYLYFPSQGNIEFNEEETLFMKEAQLLYQNAFKNHEKQAERIYYALSIAQFIVFGHARMENALALVKQDYETLFSPHFIEKGRK
jgi:hypothetical protein